MSRIDEALARASGARPEPSGRGAAVPCAPTPTACSRPNRRRADRTRRAPQPPGRARLPAPAAAPRTRRQTGRRRRPACSCSTRPCRHLPLSEKLTTRCGRTRIDRAVSPAGGRLHLAQAEHGTRVVMVTSALPGEGKTLTADQPRADAERVVPAAGAPGRRRPAPSLGPRDVPAAEPVAGLNDGLRCDDDRARCR